MAQTAYFPGQYSTPTIPLFTPSLYKAVWRNICKTTKSNSPRTVYGSVQNTSYLYFLQLAPHHSSLHWTAPYLAPVSAQGSSQSSKATSSTFPESLDGGLHIQTSS